MHPISSHPHQTPSIDPFHPPSTSRTESITLDRSHPHALHFVPCSSPNKAAVNADKRQVGNSGHDYANRTALRNPNAPAESTLAEASSLFRIFFFFRPGRKEGGGEEFRCHKRNHSDANVGKKLCFRDKKKKRKRQKQNLTSLHLYVFEPFLGAQPVRREQEMTRPISKHKEEEDPAERGGAVKVFFFFFFWSAFHPLHLTLSNIHTHHSANALRS